MILANNLTRTFGDLVAVDHIRIHVPAGQIYGFLGPNGAGKTTTIRMLTGSLKPSEGEINIMGLDMSREELEVKRLIAVVPDEPRMYENLKGYEFARFIMEIYRAPRKETEHKFNEICKAFGIDYLNSFISDYSHGMKQKLMVAIALMRQPSVIFLDEPTVGLDARSAKILKLWLKRMSENGTTIFLTTHVLEIAEKMCDRIGIIDHGKLVAEGSLAELRKGAGNDKSSLEDLFLELTGGSEFREIIEQLDD